MSIRAKVLDTAIAEAERFLEAARTAKRCAGLYTAPSHNDDPWIHSGQYCAAVKRASMDLSRALSGVRRGGG